MKAKEAASTAAVEGADVFSACDEASVLAQTELAKELDLPSTGYVGDMTSLDPNTVLASMTWNTPELLRPMIEDFNASTVTPAEFYSIGVADDGLVVKINPALADGIKMTPWRSSSNASRTSRTGPSRFPSSGTARYSV